MIRRARPGAPSPFRDRRGAVRRPRRGDQHHAAHPAVAGRRGHPPRPQPLGATRSSPPRSRRTCRAWRSAPTRAATSSTSATWSSCCASAAPATCKVYGGGGGVIVPGGDRPAARPRRRPHLLAGGRPAARPGRHDQQADRGVRRRAATALPSVEAVVLRRPGGPGQGDHPARGGPRPGELLDGLRAAGRRARRVPVLGITGTGGSGSRRSPTSWYTACGWTTTTSCASPSSPIDPTRRRGGGALLGDRIRMNSIDARRSSSARWPPAGRQRGPRLPRRRDRRLPGRRVRPGHRGDAGHRAGRRRRSCRTSTYPSTS